MSNPEVDEVLFAYVIVAPHVVSLVLIRVDNSIQRLIYYVSKSLHEAKVHYLPLEKPFWRWYMLHVNSPTTSKHTQWLSLLSFCSDLYFKVLITRGRLLNGGTILGAFDIKYMPRTFVKSQVFANLVAEFAESPLEVEAKKQGMDEKSVGMISLQDPLSWRVYVDGVAIRGDPE